MSLNDTSEMYRDWKGWSAESFAALKSADRAYFEAETQGFLSAGDEILELGFGNGGFLGFCRDRGVEAVGVELDPGLVNRAQGAGFEAYGYSRNVLKELDVGRFNAIFAFDVFEHIEYDALIDLLADMHHILKPGGLILARFPSGDSPFSGAMYNGDHTHRTLIGTGKLRQLCIATGFNIERMEGAALPIRGLGTKAALRRAVIVGVRRALFALMLPLLYSNTPRVMDPNAVCVLRKT